MSTSRRPTRTTKKVLYVVSSDEEIDNDGDDSFIVEEKAPKPPPKKRATKKSDDLKPKSVRKVLKKEAPVKGSPKKRKTAVKRSANVEPLDREDDQIDQIDSTTNIQDVKADVSNIIIKREALSPKKRRSSLRRPIKVEPSSSNANEIRDVEPNVANIRIKQEAPSPVVKSSPKTRRSGVKRPVKEERNDDDDTEIKQEAVPVVHKRVKPSRWDTVADIKPSLTNIVKDDPDNRPKVQQQGASDKPPPKKRARKTTKSELMDENYSDENLDINRPNDQNSKQPPKKPPPHIAKSSGWTVPELLAEQANIDYYCARNIITLFENDNTIPFICRYRREIVGNSMTPDTLRDIKNSYSSILNLRSKIMTTINGVEKKGQLTDEVRKAFESAKSLDELDMMYAPFKTAGKKTLAERAIALGLEQPALDLLNGTKPDYWFNGYVQRDNPDIDTVEKVEQGICHIIAHLIGKDVAVLEELRRLQALHKITIEVKKAKIVKSEKLDKEKQNHRANENEVKKFETYYDYSNLVRYLKPHQILAINRGENYKILSVKIVIPDRMKFDLKKFLEELYLRKGMYCKIRMQLFDMAFEEAFTKKFSQLVSKQIRSDLTKMAENGSIHIFAMNLKQLLLMSPIRGEKILGLDPGFAMGCKLALINEFNDLLDTAVIYPHTRPQHSRQYGFEMRDMLLKHDCKIIALGNGTACRETEKWLQNLYADGIINQTVVRYCIVSEHGASIYSCGPIAKKEFPDLDVNLVSACSIARRLADPLCELVKIEPKHLGVGMYQHDINEKDLSEALNEIVSECVSYVGVDVNTASVTLLRHVAGLTETRAQNIIKYRLDNGPFRSRKELLKVKQIGEKSFQQCAGFIRIDPKTAGYTKCNILDSTWVHPESYEIAEQIIASLKLNKSDIGKPSFINTVQMHSNEREYKLYADKLGQPVERIISIFEALQRDITRDYRSDINKKPLFKQTLTKMADLLVNDTVTGSITNITDFGCFVDIGVETNGLIHSSKLNGFNVTVGDHVEAVVVNLDCQRNRIGLSLKSIL